MVRLLAPHSLHSFSSFLCSPGFATNLCTTLCARGSMGRGNCSGTDSTAFSWSTIIFNMLWHRCDISWHNSERNPVAQVLSLLPTTLEEGTVLGSAKMVGFVPTKDYEQARAFYEGKLGFDFVNLDQYALVMRVGGHMIRIAKVPNFTPLQATILGWEVSDISAVATWLQGRGVVLEKFPFAQDRELGIWTAPNGDKVAWFKDPDGNILSVSQHNY